MSLTWILGFCCVGVIMLGVLFQRTRRPQKRVREARKQVLSGYIEAFDSLDGDYEIRIGVRPS